MSEIKDVLSLLTQLLPGFVAAWVIYGFSSFAKPTPFERIIQALVYSFLIAVALVASEKLFTWIGKYQTYGVWDKQVELLLSGLFAILLGLCVSYFSQNDKFYLLARKFRLTSRRAFPSEWYGAFKQRQLFVVLHLAGDGERRISGYPNEWPDDSDAGHFNLTQAAWLTGEAEIALNDNVDAILIPAKQVTFVEFLKPSKE